MSPTGAALLSRAPGDACVGARPDKAARRPRASGSHRVPSSPPPLQVFGFGHEYPNVGIEDLVPLRGGEKAAGMVAAAKARVLKCCFELQQPGGRKVGTVISMQSPCSLHAIFM